MTTPHADFNWNDLSYFLAVARAERLTLAARRLGVEHSTVSRRITALEAALGTQLFSRSPSGYTLTASGEQLLRYAEDMESVAGSVLSDVAGGDLALAGAVRVGAPDGFAGYFLAPRLGALRDRNPELEIELIAMPRMFSLSRREADIAIGLSRPEEGRLHARKLTDYALALYASHDYLRAHAPIRARDDLANHPMIGYADDYIFAPELDYVPLITRELRPTLRCSNVVTQLQATLGGAGLCVLPCFMGDQEPRLTRVLREDVLLKRSFWLITHADVRGLARVRATADFLLAEAQAAEALFLGSA